MKKEFNLSNYMKGFMLNLKSFLIILAIFELFCENNLQNYNPLDFLDIKRLNPYYHKLKKEIN